MKKLTKYLMVLTLLFVCMSCSKDEPIEIVSQDEATFLDFENIYDMIQIENAKSNENSINSKSSSESKNNGNGVYFVPFYSNDIRPGARWVAFLPVPETSLLMEIDFPQNGDDRAIVFSENEMMVNFTIQGPRLALRDLENWPRIKYANWCEENKTGLYTMRGRTTYNAIDQNDDGIIDLYHWGPNAPGTEIDKNFLIHVKSTLTNSCREPTEIVDFSYILQARNGRLRETATIK